MPPTIRHYKIYRISGLIRWLVLVVAILVGLGIAASLILPADPKTLAPDVINNPKYDILYVVPFICAALVFYVVLRRVKLYSDAIEIRGILGTKKYLRSDIKGVSQNGTLFFNSSKETIGIPTNIHPDYDYRKWFETLPQLGDVGFNFGNEVSGTGNWKNNIDPVEAIVEIEGVTKGMARFRFVMYVLIFCAICAIICIRYPQFLYVLIYWKLIIFFIVCCGIGISKILNRDHGQE